MRGLKPGSDYLALLGALRDDGAMNTVSVAAFLVWEYPKKQRTGELFAERSTSGVALAVGCWSYPAGFYDGLRVFIRTSYARASGR